MANDVFIRGANAIVIQDVKIGANLAIGAGSTVLDDVPENKLVTGVWVGDNLGVYPERRAFCLQKARCAA